MDLGVMAVKRYPTGASPSDAVWCHTLNTRLGNSYQQGGWFGKLHKLGLCFWMKNILMHQWMACSNRPWVKIASLKWDSKILAFRLGSLWYVCIPQPCRLSSKTKHKNKSCLWYTIVQYFLKEGDPKFPFSKATTPRCRGGRNSFPWITPLYPWYVPYNAEC